jgi:hypothetical protein
MNEWDLPNINQEVQVKNETIQSGKKIFSILYLLLNNRLRKRTGTGEKRITKNGMVPVIDKTGEGNSKI